MTIDERVKDFAKFKDSAAWEVYLKSAFQEVARDQRQASRDAADAIDQNLFNKSRVLTVIMNATIK